LIALPYHRGGSSYRLLLSHSPSDNAGKRALSSHIWFQRNHVCASCLRIWTERERERPAFVNEATSLVLVSSALRVTGDAFRPQMERRGKRRRREGLLNDQKPILSEGRDQKVVKGKVAPGGEKSTFTCIIDEIARPPDLSCPKEARPKEQMGWKEALACKRGRRQILEDVSGME